jgi:hypothetical protein
VKSSELQYFQINTLLFIPDFTVEIVLQRIELLTAANLNPNYILQHFLLLTEWTIYIQTKELTRYINEINKLN